MMHQQTASYGATKRSVSEQDSPDGLQIVRRVVSISKAGRALFGLKLAEIGFHNGQDELVLVLGEGPMTVSALAERLCVRPSTVSKTCDRLVAKDLVGREGCPKDARRTLIFLTAKGQAARKHIQSLWEDVGNELAQPFDDEELAVLSDELRKLDDHLGRRLMRLR